LEDAGDWRLDAARHVEDATVPNGREEGPGDVVHMHVVARRRPKSEQGRRDATPQGVAEQRHNTCLAVRTLTRAVYVGEPADRVANAAGFSPGDDICLGCP